MLYFIKFVLYLLDFLFTAQTYNQRTNIALNQNMKETLQVVGVIMIAHQKVLREVSSFSNTGSNPVGTARKPVSIHQIF
jgi:hypothetical protein